MISGFGRGIYGSRIRNSLDIEPTVKSSLFFCEETLFDIGEIHSILNKKKNVTSKIIPGKHGFYGKVDYDHSMIRKLNEEIFKIIEEQ